MWKRAARRVEEWGWMGIETVSDFLSIPEPALDVKRVWLVVGNSKLELIYKLKQTQFNLTTLRLVVVLVFFHTILSAVSLCEE